MVFDLPDLLPADFLVDLLAGLCFAIRKVNHMRNHHFHFKMGLAGLKDASKLLSSSPFDRLRSPI